MTATFAVKLLMFAGAGLALGLAHFAALRANVRLYIASGPIWRPIALNLARLAATGGAVVAAVALGGALPTLAVVAGFVLARMVVLRVAWSSP